MEYKKREGDVVREILWSIKKYPFLAISRHIRGKFDISTGCKRLHKLEREGLIKIKPHPKYPNLRNASLTKAGLEYVKD